MSMVSEIVHNLPRQATSFIGRDDELATIGAQLKRVECRLISLVGPGGIGKTRLAIEIGAQATGDYADGVHFVPLAPLTAADNIVPAIASVVGFQFHQGDPPRQQLLDTLQDRQLLLILDNVEHVLDGVDLVVDILNTTQSVKLLVTSREVLNLQAEWVRSIKGMPYPENGTLESLESYSAVELFTERARRVRADFSLADERMSVIRICQLVEGMPLALELAASWCKVLSCEAIVDQLESGLDLLATKLRDVEARHRSIQAVFDQSWAMLTAEEQVVLAGLSVINGGFTAEAAEQVTGASLPLLASLADKSFIQVDAARRYNLHELLRQYASAHLDATPAVKEQALEQHCDYYACFVSENVSEIAYGDMGPVLIEIDNLRAAWGWAVEGRKLAQIADMTEGLSLFFADRLGLMTESRAQFERATTALAMDEPIGEQGIIYGLVLIVQGMAEADLGYWEKAHALMDAGLDILRRLDAPRPVVASGLHFASYGAYNPAERKQMLEEFITISTELGEQWRVAHGLYLLGVLHPVDRRDEAQAYFHEMLRIAQVLDNPLLTASALTRLGEIACHTGGYGRARSYVQEALRLFENSYPVRLMTCLWLLGILDMQQCQYAEAEQCYRASLAIAEMIGRKVVVAWNLGGLALVAGARGDHVEAKRFAGECLAMWEKIGGQEGIAGTLVTMGYLAVERGDTDEAVRYYTEAQRKGREVGLVSITLEVVMGLANLIARRGKRERAVELLALALPKSWDTSGGLERKPLYAKLRDDLEVELEPAIFQAAWARGEKLDLEATVSQLFAQFSPEDETASWNANEALIEPLTKRELDVLHLLAEGRSNRQIAAALTIAVGTVKRYVYTVCQKLDAANRTQAVINAQRLKLL